MTEAQKLAIEAMLWKQMYFDQQRHYGQVIALLLRPTMPPQQITEGLQPQPPEDAVNAAQEPPQPPGQTDKAEA